MTKFIALVSGKGGTGKTTATINLGQALVNQGKKVLLLDGNLVTPNIGVHLGQVNPSGTVNHFLRKAKQLRQVIYLHESGLTYIPASPSYEEFQKTNVEKLSEIFEHLDDQVDIVLVDAPSGLGYDVEQVMKNCDEILLVVNPQLSSVMDGLKTLEMAKSHNLTVAGAVLNLSHKGKYELKPDEVEKIIGIPLLANVREDKKFRKALYHQSPLVYLYPRSRAAKEFQKIATQITL